MSERAEWAAEQDGLSRDAQAVLEALAEAWPTSPGELAARLGMSRIGVEKALRELDDRGLHRTRG